MRRRASKKYWKRLSEISRLQHPPSRDELLRTIGRAEAQAGAAAGLVRVTVSAEASRRICSSPSWPMA